MQKQGGFKLVDTAISKFYSSSPSKFCIFFFFSKCCIHKILKQKFRNYIFFSQINTVLQDCTQCKPE